VADTWIYHSDIVSLVPVSFIVAFGCSHYNIISLQAHHAVVHTEGPQDKTWAVEKLP
jgi:hypothetical protein